MERGDLLFDKQNGFREGCSCQDHVYVLTFIIRNRNTQKLSTYAAFVDFEKAFDWVDRDLLFYKLASQFGIGGKIYNAIKSLYDQPTARVKINERYTETFHITSGVKQGDNLSPTLFAMYLNDLAVEVKSLNCGIDINGRQVTILLYADYIVLLAPNERSLQKQLDAIYNWCRKWRMKVNTKDKKQKLYTSDQKVLPSPKVHSSMVIVN